MACIGYDVGTTADQVVITVSVTGHDYFEMETGTFADIKTSRSQKILREFFDEEVCRAEVEPEDERDFDFRVMNEVHRWTDLLRKWFNQNRARAPPGEDNGISDRRGMGMPWMQQRKYSSVRRVSLR